MKKFISFLLFLFMSIGMITATDFTLTSASSVTQDGITVTFGKGAGSNSPAWYSAGLRLYASNTITINSTSEISGVTFNWEKQGSKAFASVTADCGEYTHPSNTGNGTWSGSENEIIFTLGTFGQLQLNTFTVTLSGPVIHEYTLKFTQASTKVTELNENDIVYIINENAKCELSEITTVGSAIVGVTYQYTQGVEGKLPLQIKPGYEDGYYAFKTGDVYMSWTSGNTLNTSEAINENSSWNVTFDNGNAVIANAADLTRIIKYNSNSPRFACYTSSQQTVQLCSLSNGIIYRSIYLDYPVAIPDGVEVYTAELSGNVLTLSEVTDYIPENTGVIIKADEGSYTFTETNNVVSPIANNSLQGGETTTQDGYTYYALHYGSKGYGFYIYTGSTIPANKAYLKVANTSAPDFIRVENMTDSVTTDIRYPQLRIQPEVKKYFHNGQLYIKHNNNIYTVLGIKTKQD